MPYFYLHQCRKKYKKIYKTIIEPSLNAVSKAIKWVIPTKHQWSCYILGSSQVSLLLVSDYTKREGPSPAAPVRFLTRLALVKTRHEAAFQRRTIPAAHAETTRYAAAPDGAAMARAPRPTIGPMWPVSTRRRRPRQSQTWRDESLAPEGDLLTYMKEGRLFGAVFLHCIYHHPFHKRNPPAWRAKTFWTLFINQNLSQNWTLKGPDP
jgi:hypothetical protein